MISIPKVSLPSIDVLEALLPVDSGSRNSDWYREARENLYEHRLIILPSPPWADLVKALTAAYSELLGVPSGEWTALLTSGMSDERSSAMVFLTQQRAVFGDMNVSDRRYPKEAMVSFVARMNYAHYADDVFVRGVTTPYGHSALYSKVTCSCGEEMPHGLFDRHRRQTLFHNGAMVLSQDNAVDISKKSLTALHSLVDSNLSIRTLDKLTELSDYFRTTVGNAIW